MRVVVWEKAEAEQGVLYEQEERMGDGFRCLDDSADGTSKALPTVKQMYILMVYQVENIPSSQH